MQERPVADIIKARLPLTILINSLTLLFQWIISIPIGVISAVKQRSIFDYIATFLAFLGRSIPNFLLALTAMVFFYYTFGWSIGGLFSPAYAEAPWSLAKVIDLGKHLVIPIIVIGTAGMAGLVRVLRGTMLDELGKPYMQTARARGLKEATIIIKHPLRVAMNPLISTSGWMLATVVSGAMITSIVLNLPTMGEALYQALFNQDMYLAGSIILIVSVAVVIGTLLSDIVLALFDPRITYE